MIEPFEDDSEEASLRPVRYEDEVYSIPLGQASSQVCIRTHPDDL